MKTFRLLVLALSVGFLSRLALGQQPEDIRTRLAKIDVHGGATIEDYLVRAKQVMALVPQMEAFYKNGSETLAAARRKYSTRPGLLRLTKFIERLNERDLFGFQLLKEELRLASILDHLPEEQRQAFLDAKISPLIQVEANVVDEEVEMAIDGVNSGLPLPQDILKSLKARQTIEFRQQH
jgi:hypothetical protein